jgi:hypothetical protein
VVARNGVTPPQLEKSSAFLKGAAATASLDAKPIPGR